jgi:hypothetical protein
LTESELINWICLAYPKRSVSYWQVLQCVIDAGWLQDVYLHHWSSRTFFLRPLICVWQFINDDLYRLHFDGALPKALRNRIKVVLNNNGVSMRFGNSVSPFAPPPLFAEVRQSQLEKIAKALGVPLIEMKLNLISEDTINRNISMNIHKTWCWIKKRFVEPIQAQKQEMDGVRLDKLRFNTQNGMDRYQVTSTGQINQYYLPQIAINMAYLLAKKPLFDLIAGELVCLAQQPSISAELARFWRLQTLTSSGPVERESGIYQYVYYCPNESLLCQGKNLNRLLLSDPLIIPLWMKALTMQSVFDGDQVLLCEKNGLLSPEINVLL